MNSLPKTPSYNSWLQDAVAQLSNIGITSARLDAELLLAHTLNKPRTYLHAHGDEPMTDRQYEIANARLDLRRDHVPLAYIIGHKEFYGHRFAVTTATLIPRPESEVMIDLLKEIIGNNASLLPEKQQRLVDVGTGSGNLGITAKLLFPQLEVTLIDTSRHALNVAEANAKSLHAEVLILQSDLLDQYPFKADYILANLPYVDPAWEHSPEIEHEPAGALYADDNGTALIRRLLQTAVSHLQPGGYVFIEADPVQHDSLTQYAKKYGLTQVAHRDYQIVFRATL